MQFPYPIVRVLRINNADGSVAIQIGPGPSATWYGSNGSQLVITADDIYPTLYFWNANHDNAAYINQFGGNSDANLGLNSGGFPSIRYPTIANAQVTAQLRTDVREFFAQIQTAPGQVAYGGSIIVGERDGRTRLRDISGNTLANDGVWDRNSSGTPDPYVTSEVANAGVLGGMYVKTDGVTFADNINESFPIRWNRTTRWLVVDQYDWTALLLGANWVAAPTYLTPAAKMMPDGVVTLCGTIQGGTTTDNTNLFNLPFSAMAPSGGSVLVRPATSVGNANARFLINTSAQVFCYGIAAGSQLGLDGITFRCSRP